MKKVSMDIDCDAEPLLAFVHLFNLGLQRIQSPVKIGDLPSEVCRVEQDHCPADAGEIFVRFYPSDAFLRFAAAVFARKLDCDVINDPSHKTSEIVTAGIDVQRDGYGIFLNTNPHPK